MIKIFKIGLVGVAFAVGSVALAWRGHFCVALPLNMVSTVLGGYLMGYGSGYGDGFKKGREKA